MRKLPAATALALFSLTPALGSACEYYDASSASTTPPAQLASAPAPAASIAPTSTVLKAAPAPKTTTKRIVVKSKEPAPDAKVAALATN